uniref:Uncharacterized protein n=1 Tax=Calcidiscus leptoporus TaxID=127549 RepID=A0A7S0IUR3_9EUKA|mmetsp:Transcript_23912/g.55495  ORF Transcript_23912/g.55495 Transcript_23912/m.55495 type:complete len:176 (+) Transcript_23912:282-809(+)
MPHEQVRDDETDVPYLLEGSLRGATMRTYEERLLQDTDHCEVTVLPLRGVNDDARPALRRFAQEELRLQRTRGGFDVSSSSDVGAPCCQNLWMVYSQLRSRARVGDAAETSNAREGGTSGGLCTFGAPLVATALQRLGVLELHMDVERVTPAALPALQLTAGASFGKPFVVRGAS